jgi:hypothetical protein
MAQNNWIILPGGLYIYETSQLYTVSWDQVNARHFFSHKWDFKDLNNAIYTSVPHALIEINLKLPQVTSY